MLSGYGFGCPSKIDRAELPAELISGPLVVELAL